MGQEIVTQQKKSILLTMASEYGMEPDAFEATVRATCSPSGRDGVKQLTREEFAAFLLVAKQYDLNPLTKEIYAYPKKGGGIVPVVSVDGWINLINSQPMCDGWDMAADLDAKGQLVSYTCKMFRKDRSHPAVITEYLSECVRDTEPWKMKHRMLRHKTLIQAGRYTFGFAGIYDEDEGDRIAEARDITPKRVAPPPPPATVIEPPKEEKPKDEPPMPYHRGLAVLLTEAREKVLGGRRVFDSWFGALPIKEQTELQANGHMKELMATAKEHTQAQAKAELAEKAPKDEAPDKAKERRAPPPPPAAAAPHENPPADPEKLRAKFIEALAECKDEDEANDAYVRIIDPYDDVLFPPDSEEFSRMLRHRVAELEP